MEPTHGAFRKPNHPFEINLAAAERAATRVEKDENGCWISTYSVASHGYAQVGWTHGDHRHMVTAHRASWVHFNGPIPDGMTVDHLCRVRRCVNPDHLRLLDNLTNARSNGQNRRRAPAPAGEQCIRGHEVYQYASGAKHCKECANEWSARKVARQQLRRSGLAA